MRVLKNLRLSCIVGTSNKALSYQSSPDNTQPSFYMLTAIVTDMGGGVSQVGQSCGRRPQHTTNASLLGDIIVGVHLT